MSERQDEMSISAWLAEILELARLLGLEPDNRILAKIYVLQELLKRGYSARRAIASVRLGWKNYYKYSPLIYDDPENFIPIPKRVPLRITVF